MKFRYVYVVALLILILVSLQIIPNVVGQDDEPSPTKTPDVDTTQEVEIDSSEEPDTLTFVEPLTQSDLTVLSGNVQRPNGFGWFGDNIYAVCNGDWTLYEIDDTSGSTRTYIYGVRNGHTLFIEGTGEVINNLWIPDYDLNALLQVNPARAPVEIVNNLEGPWGIAYYDEEHFLITNLVGNSISKISRDGLVEEIVTELRSPTGIVYDEDIVYFANNASARRSVEWFSLDDETDDIVIQPLVSGLQNTTNLVQGPDDLLYFAYALGTRGVVGRVDPEVCIENGGCSNDQVEIVLYTELAAPLAGLTISPDMRLFIHTIFRPEIYWVQLDNEQLE